LGLLGGHVQKGVSPQAESHGIDARDAQLVEQGVEVEGTLAVARDTPGALRL